jgi:hypothetical protein
MAAASAPPEGVLVGKTIFLLVFLNGKRFDQNVPYVLREVNRWSSFELVSSRRRKPHHRKTSASFNTRASFSSNQ